jgi:hypothetical protein
VGHGLYGPLKPNWCDRSRHEGRLSGVGTLGKKSVTPEPDAFQKAHFTMIQQLHLITPFVNEHSDNYVKTTLTVVGLSLQISHARFQQVAPRLC